MSTRPQVLLMITISRSREGREIRFRIQNVLSAGATRHSAKGVVPYLSIVALCLSGSAAHCPGVKAYCLACRCHILSVFIQHQIARLSQSKCTISVEHKDLSVHTKTGKLFRQDLLPRVASTKLFIYFLQVICA